MDDEQKAQVRKLSDFDQAMKLCGESMPPLWRAIYLGNLAAGFSEAQAMRLLEVFIFGAAGDRKL